MAADDEDVSDAAAGSPAPSDHTPTPSPVNGAKPPVTLPKSATHFGLNTIALGVVLATFWYLRSRDKPLGSEVLVLAGAVAIPIVFFDIFVLKVHRRPSTGLDWDKAFAPDAGRVLTKIVGLVAAIAPFALGYWVFPEYNGSFYSPLWDLLGRFALSLAIAIPLYITIVDGQMREPRDAYWQLGRFVLGHREDAKGADIGNLYKGWLVKAFFFPLMYVWLSNSTHNTVTFDLRNASWSNLRAYDFLYDFVFFIDLLFTTVGYALSMRPFDSHIRTAEPTFLGWGVALFCYRPFYSLFERQYVHYDQTSFGNWLSGMPTFRWVWAVAILVLIAIYALATVAFGIRFSNLTHRGILTNGPFRYTKHPAYVTKNISWWLAAVPFVIVDHQPWMTIKHCIALGLINFMYFMRAKTEERHLSRDPVYVEYALWMNEHGVLRFLNRIPIFKYKPPAEIHYEPALGESAYAGVGAPSRSRRETNTDVTFGRGRPAVRARRRRRDPAGGPRLACWPADRLARSGDRRRRRQAACPSATRPRRRRRRLSP